MGVRSKADRVVDLLGTTQILHEHLTASLCEEVFDEVRTTERRRLWGLEQLARFWTAVTLTSPASLTHALDEAGRGAGPYPRVEASPQAFFARSQDLRWEFFCGLFEAFRERAEAGEPLRFASTQAGVLDRFAAALAVDGSKLDAVARRLKLLWDDRRVPLPGSVVAFYDLRRGTVRRLAFNPKAACAELHDAIAALDELPSESLVVGDRLYAVPMWFSELGQRGQFGLARLNRTVKIEKREQLSSCEHEGGKLVDWEVEAGAGKHGPQRLRLIQWTKGKTKRELLTNVLDVERLGAAEALSIYPLRWKVERLFYDLKEVIDLHRLYAANVNAIAMQVFSAAIVHTALRIAQGRIAEQVGIEPECLSVPKLFPKIAAASIGLTFAELAFAATQKANPRVRLTKPDMRMLAFATTTLKAILLQKRSSHRRKRRYCEARRKWRSLPMPRRAR